MSRRIHGAREDGASFINDLLSLTGVSEKLMAGIEEVMHSIH